jgi:hypothetical protein
MQMATDVTVSSILVPIWVVALAVTGAVAIVLVVVLLVRNRKG